MAGQNSSRTYFSKTDWQEWLSCVSNFFKSYRVASILPCKPPNDSRPYVNVLINDLEVHGLLDSGSAVTLLGRNFHRALLKLGSHMTNNESIQVVAAGGQHLRSIGYINLNITFENVTQVIKAFVVPEIETSLILGIDFWRAFKICPKYLSSLQILNPTASKITPSTLSSNLQSYGHLSDDQRIQADHVINQFKEVSFEKKGLGRTSLIKHNIDTGETQPIRQRYYRMSTEKIRIVNEQVDEMLSLDVIEPCESPWSSPVLVVGKKDGKPRFCLDSRKLNSVTKKDAYSLPYISEILDNLRDAKYLTSIDLSKAFWQIPINEADKAKTAFYVPQRGTFCFKTMAFGLTNAPATQQRLVDRLFGPEFDLKVFCYLDDIVCVSDNFESHVSLLLRVLAKLKEANLTINFEKTQFFRDSLKYLGYVVDTQGLRTDPDKVEAIIKYPVPTSKKDVKRFLGTASWYRRFVPNFSTLAGPLNKLTSTKKGAEPFSWSPEADEAFNKLKECLVSTPVLSCPNFNLPFEVHTDASDYGVGAMLCQIVDGQEHPIAFMSKALTANEKNYSITERETLAVLLALEHWRCYIENGKTFKVYTDHSALKWFLSLNNPTGRLARWGVRLSAFDFEILHRRGKDNVVPDALSRAVQVSAISTADSYLRSQDTWYVDIYHGCTNNPQSYPNYTIKNNSLYRLTKSKGQLTDEFAWKEVVPSELRQQLISENHAQPTAGHLGGFKTYHRLSLRYFWPGMYRDVVRYIATCDTCMAYKHPTHATLGEMGRPKHCSRPFQMISIDFVGPLPVSRKRNSYLLVVTCCFSKYCLLFPVRRATADVVIRSLEESVFLTHGVPQSIFMDNGTQFISRDLSALFNKYKIPNQYFTPKYTPQVNTVERYNKTIVTSISTFVANDHRSWDSNISKIQFAINNSVNETTGYTPAFLVFGRELVTCGSHYIDNDLGDEVIFLPRDAYAENLGCLSDVFDKVQKSLYHAHEKNASRYNSRRKPAEFNVGDIVWKRTYHLSDKSQYFSKKLAPKFVKCKVTAKKSPLVYVLQDMSGNDLGTWHIKDIKYSNLKN